MADPRPESQRLVSLDVFRGATIALMILVNNAGDWGKTYRPLLHATWHGWTPTDLVFPFFLFIVGVAIPLAFAPRLEKGRRAGLWRKILRRGLLLFLLGLALIWFPYVTVDWSRARIPGVLQRIAVVYLAAAFAYLSLKPRGRALLGAGLLLVYGSILAFVPAPGFAAGDLSPEGNIAFAVDALVLGRHVWRYSPGPGDPEGILSTLGAIASAIAGLFAGEALRARRGAAVAKPMVAWGAAAVAAGLLLDRLQPINKNLWTPAYVLFTTGAALLVLAVTHLVVDTPPRPPRWAWLFTIFGVNAILAYVGSGVVARTLGVIELADPTAASGQITLQKWFYSRFFDAPLPDYVASLAWALANVALWVGILAWLHRRNIRLKV